MPHLHASGFTPSGRGQKSWAASTCGLSVPRIYQSVGHQQSLVRAVYPKRQQFPPTSRPRIHSLTHTLISEYPCRKDKGSCALASENLYRIRTSGPPAQRYSERAISTGIRKWSGLFYPRANSIPFPLWPRILLAWNSYPVRSLSCSVGWCAYVAVRCVPICSKIWCLPASPIRVTVTLVELPDKGGAERLPIQRLRSDLRFRAPGIRSAVEVWSYIRDRDGKSVNTQLD